MRDRAPSIGLWPGLIAAAAALFFLAGILRAGTLQAQSDAAEVRALWVVRATLASAAAIDTMVDAAKAAGFNTLLVQVDGVAGAQETVAANRFDPLAETLDRAHAAGLAVHAWMTINRVADAADLPSRRDHVVYRHPEWLMVPQALADDLIRIDPKSPEYLGRLARYVRAQSANVDGLYLSPIPSGSADYLAAAVGDLLARYPVDGVHFDAVAYPRAEPLIYTEAFPERWRIFRAGRLTASMSLLREAVRAVRPSALVSAAVIPDVSEASTGRMQDWRGWLDRGLIDVACPMTSTTDATLFASEVASARRAAGGHPLWAGIGASGLSQLEIVANVQAARRLGVGGVVLFSYDSLTGPSRGTEYLAQLGRAAFMQ